MGNMVSKISKILDSNLLFKVGALSSIFVFILYFLSPADQSESIPSAFASRFLWTPLIPMFLAISVICLTMSGFYSKLDKFGFVVSANLIFMLILLSPQFAEATPIEADGWWFLQITERYGEYGNDGTEGYLSKMLVLIPLDVMNRILPGHSALIASIFGFLMSIAWITIVSASIRFDEHTIKWGIPSLIFICFLMVAWWSPLQYSAQMLGLLLVGIAVHMNHSGVKGNARYFLALTLISATHLQSSIILGAILLAESFLRTEQSKLARLGALWLGVCFVSWNLTVSKVSFLRQFPDSFSERLGYWLLLPILLVSLISYYYEKKFGIREKEVWGGSTFFSNFSIVLGCLLVSPMMYYADFRMGTARILPRLLSFCVVPLSSFIIFSLSRSEKVARNSKFVNSYGFAIFAVLSLLAGSLSAVAHSSYASRTLMIPEKTVDCWEMTEESGIVGLMEPHSGEINLILHSHSMISMSDYENWGYFIRLGDEVELFDIYLTEQFNGSGIYYSAFLETADFDDDDLNRVGLDPEIFSTFVVVGEVPGACRFWVDSNDLELLNPALSWDSTVPTD